MADDFGEAAPQEGGGFDKEKIIALLKKFAPFLVAAVVVVGGVLFYFSLPKPATVTVCVDGLDQATKVEAASVTFSRGDESWSVDLEDRCGELSGTLPAGVELSVEVDAGSKYSSTPDPSSVILEPGTNTVNLKLPYDYKLSANQKSFTIDTAPGCNRTIILGVKNNGKSAAEIGLVPEGDARQYLFVPPFKTIAAGADTTIAVSVLVPAAGQKTITGALRLAHTTTKIPVTINVGEGAKLSITPTSVRLSNDDKVLVTVKNAGKTDVTDLRVETCYSEEKISVSYNAQSITKFLAPGSQTTFPVDVYSAEPGKFFAKLCISDGGCQATEVPITLEKAAPRS
ncbi:MAG: hypothetical protein ACP5O3_00965 [Candidatus Micrarchaeia archaeon]|jgi:hypothetical protein